MACSFVKTFLLCLSLIAAGFACPARAQPKAAQEQSLIARERAVESSNAFKSAIDEVIATQAGAQLTVGDLVAQIDRVTPGKRLTGLRDPKTLTSELDRVLTARLLAAEARKRGLDKSIVFKLELKQMEEQILMRRLIQSSLPDFDDEKLERAAREQYRIKQRDYSLPESRSISHILISTDGRTKADALLRALEVQALLKKAGSSFEALAKTKSDDKTTRDNGGLIGDLRLGAGASMEAEVFAMQATGLLSNPVETASGYHIIKLNSITPPRVMSYDEVRDQLVSQIRDSASGMTRDGLLNSIVGREPFKLNDAALKKFFSVMGADDHAMFKEADPKAAAAERARAKPAKATDSQ